MTWACSQVECPRKWDLTQVPGSWQRARGQIRDFARRVRKNYRWEWAWSIEANPRGTGFHLHSCQWGDYVPRDEVTELWGGRRTWVEAIHKDAYGYMVKCSAVAGYMQKNALGYLDLNGGRAVHYSRGFLHGKTARQLRSEMAGDRTWRAVVATADEVAFSTAMLERLKGDNESNVDIPWKVGKVIDDQHGLPTITLTDGF